LSDSVANHSEAKRIGVYGGAFDPVHMGHLRSALEVKQTLTLDELRFLPSGTPPHRAGARTDAKHRLAMLNLAVRNAKDVVIDERELSTDETSYSYDTLCAIAAEFPASRLTLIIGMDQFSVFDTWHRWQDLLESYDVAVMERPGEQLSGVGLSILQNAERQTGGARVHIVAVTQLDISSTRLRADLASNRDIQFLVPAAVRDYIISHGLYAHGLYADGLRA